MRLYLLIVALLAMLAVVAVAQDLGVGDADQEILESDPFADQDGLEVARDASLSEVEAEAAEADEEEEEAGEDEDEEAGFTELSAEVMSKVTAQAGAAEACTAYFKGATCKNKGMKANERNFWCGMQLTTKGLCKNPQHFCCTPPLTNCEKWNGSCMNKGQPANVRKFYCSQQVTTKGLCPNAQHFCCLPQPNNCEKFKGACKKDGKGCHKFQDGLCQGRRPDQKCCLPKPAPPPAPTGGCGPYSSAQRFSIRGNNNVVYTVQKLRPEHLSDPGAYNAGPEARDNSATVDTACAFNKLHEAAKRAGVRILVSSAFRTLARQNYFWNCYQTKRCNGGNLAARPGRSNHGIGAAMDLNCSSKGSAQYRWMAGNAHNFGFVRTVPTEAWHWEYRAGWKRAPYT